MEDLTKTSSPSLSDDDPFFDYIPIGLDSSSPPVLETAFSNQSWVDEACNVANETLSILCRNSEPEETADGKERSSFPSMHESFSLPEGPNGFDEAFSSFCTLSPLEYDLLSGSSKSPCETESSNECSGLDPPGILSSIEEAGNACGVKQHNQPLSTNQELPDIIITETREDQDASQPQALLHGMKTASLEQPGTSAKPFLHNPIQLHFNNSGKVEFLVRLSYDEVRTQMPEWLELYQEQLKLLGKESTLSESRARLPKRKRSDLWLVIDG